MDSGLGASGTGLGSFGLGLGFAGVGYESLNLQITPSGLIVFSFFGSISSASLA